MEANDRATRHQALRQFFLYLVDEGELTDSPMARMKPPSIPDVPVPIVTDNEQTSRAGATWRFCDSLSTRAVASPR